MFFNFNTVTQWIDNLLGSVMPGWAATLVECVLVALAVITLYAVFAIILIYMERKICAFFQCRLGPMRVGKWGSIQVVSDVLKMLTKEIIDLKNVDRLLHKMAPFLVIIASMLTFSCLPWNKGAGIIDFNVGIVFFLASGSIGVVGILLAGWSSNNKYALIGAMRSGAQIISYELSCGLSILTMVVLMGTMQFSEIVEGQADGWFIFKGHIPALIAFIIYLIAGNAETNRGPFDLPEAESELTAGYHTEYSGMGFGFFYLAEYLNLFIVASVAATIFLGLCVGATMTVDAFINVQTLGIVAGGFCAFALSIASGICMAKIWNLFAKKKVNPLIGATGLSAVPMASRVCNGISTKYDPKNHVLNYCMSSNISGVIGSAVAAGVLISYLG